MVPYTGEQDILRWEISHFLEVNCISIHPGGIGTELLEGKLRLNREDKWLEARVLGFGFVLFEMGGLSQLVGHGYFCLEKKKKRKKSSH